MWHIWWFNGCYWVRYFKIIIIIIYILRILIFILLASKTFKYICCYNVVSTLDRPLTNFIKLILHSHPRVHEFYLTTAVWVLGLGVWNVKRPVGYQKGNGTIQLSLWMHADVNPSPRREAFTLAGYGATLFPWNRISTLKHAVLTDTHKHPSAWFSINNKQAQRNTYHVYEHVHSHRSCFLPHIGPVITTRTIG